MLKGFLEINIVILILLSGNFFFFSSFEFFKEEHKSLQVFGWATAYVKNMQSLKYLQRERHEI